MELKLKVLAETLLNPTGIFTVLRDRTGAEKPPGQQGKSKEGIVAGGYGNL